jgi:hypothetical protein
MAAAIPALKVGLGARSLRVSAAKAIGIWRERPPLKWDVERMAQSTRVDY